MLKVSLRRPILKGVEHQRALKGLKGMFTAAGETRNVMDPRTELIDVFVLCVGDTVVLQCGTLEARLVVLAMQWGYLVSECRVLTEAESLLAFDELDRAALRTMTLG